MITWPLRIILFVIVALCFLYGSYLVGVVLLFLLSIQYRAYEFIPLAFCIDCYYSPEPIMFWYTGAVTSVVVLGIILQPYLRRRQLHE